MIYRFDGYNWIVRLEKGERLVEMLTKLVTAENIGGAWISGLGGAAWAELGYYDLDNKEYRWKKLDQLLEITSLQGNIAWNGDEPILHIHGSFSDSGMKAYGGHVKELTVGGTCEILLHRIYTDKLTRSFNEQIGLNLFDL